MRHTSKKLHGLPPNGSVKEPWQSRRLAHFGLGLLNQCDDSLSFLQSEANQFPSSGGNRRFLSPIYKMGLVS